MVREPWSAGYWLNMWCLKYFIKITGFPHQRSSGHSSPSWTGTGRAAGGGVLLSALTSSPSPSPAGASQDSRRTKSLMSMSAAAAPKMSSPAMVPENVTSDQLTSAEDREDVMSTNQRYNTQTASKSLLEGLACDLLLLLKRFRLSSPNPPLLIRRFQEQICTNF